MISDEWSTLDWKFLMKKCLNNKWKSFRHFSGDQVHMRHWQAKDIESFSIKCSNLKLLIMGLDMNASMQSWPMLAAPWTSLQDITIHCRPNFGRIFEDVELHMTLPNLWRIVLTDTCTVTSKREKPLFFQTSEDVIN